MAGLVGLMGRDGGQGEEDSGGDCRLDPQRAEDPGRVCGGFGHRNVGWYATALPGRLPAWRIQPNVERIVDHLRKFYDLKRRRLGRRNPHRFAALGTELIRQGICSAPSTARPTRARAMPADTTSLIEVLLLIFGVVVGGFAIGWCYAPWRSSPHR